MKKFCTLLTLSALSLVSCSSVSVSYNVSIHKEDPGMVSSLLVSIQRVIERRLDSRSVVAQNIAVAPMNEGSSRITVALSSEEEVSDLSAGLLSPFSLSFALSSPLKDADFIVNQKDGFTKTSVDGSSILWVKSETQPDGKGLVTLQFTPEGQQKIQELFQNHSGQKLGIFVREQLITSLIINPLAAQEEISIGGIPNPEMGRVFADDVNVGLFTTFSLSE